MHNFSGQKGPKNEIFLGKKNHPGIFAQFYKSTKFQKILIIFKVYSLPQS